MSKLSEPVAKALDKLSTHCKGDNIMIMRIILGNYSPDQYSLQLFEEIYLLRRADFNDILSALVEGLPQAIKTTEQPSVAAAVGDRTKIRLAKTDGMLYDTRTGRQVLEFGYNESGEQLNEADADQIMASVNRDAPRGNTDLEGILTEEELNKITNNIGNLELWDPRTTIERLITSHRNLLSANAELSFKNMKLKEICKKSFNFVDAMENFMGDNLQVVGWHQNGDFEPLDNFISENIDSNLWQDLKAITSEVKS